MQHQHTRESRSAAFKPWIPRVAEWLITFEQHTLAMSRLAQSPQVAAELSQLAQCVGTGRIMLCNGTVATTREQRSAIRIVEWLFEDEPQLFHANRREYDRVDRVIWAAISELLPQRRRHAPCGPMAWSRTIEKRLWRLECDSSARGSGRSKGDWTLQIRGRPIGAMWCFKRLLFSARPKDRMERRRLLQIVDDCIEVDKVKLKSLPDDPTSSPSWERIFAARLTNLQRVRARLAAHVEERFTRTAVRPGSLENGLGVTFH
jgi:hypothetical protein